MTTRRQAAAKSQGAGGAPHAALEDHILARDQIGASAVYCDLPRAARSLPEMLAETVRVHAPFTHVPYHERIDDGFVNFVNNDHCLLSARATLHLTTMLDGAPAGLPMAQTIWYVPTALDIWNQEIALCFLEDYGKNGAPGSERLLLACAQHTARDRKYGDFREAGRRFTAAMT